jgi:hypothetical protein
MPTARRRATRMHGTLVALPSGIMFGVFWAVKQFHSYCLFFSRRRPGTEKVAKTSGKLQFLAALRHPIRGARPAFFSKF